MRQLIGALSLLLVAIVFVAGDLWGRLVVEPIGRFRPDRRERAVRRHVGALRDAILWILRRVGRARFDIGTSVPCRGGTLILMNHQSLMDIPVAFAMVPEGYPRMVTHHRYAKGIPLVSHIIRMSGAIAVYPGQTGKSELDRLADAARAAQHPIVLFPEGHRTRDGEIRPWKRGALDAFLSARPWTVHVAVLDGLWQAARIPDFIRNLTRVDCRVESAGVFEYDGRGRSSHDEFVDRARALMCAKLAEVRRAAGAASRDATPSRAAQPVNQR